MTLRRRITAGFAATLLLQLTLLGSGLFCTPSSGEQADSSPEMAGMAMAHTNSPAVGAAHASVSEAPAQHAGDCARGHQECGQPWAPGHCAGMASCTAFAGTPAVAVASDEAVP